MSAGPIKTPDISYALEADLRLRLDREDRWLTAHDLAR